MNVTIELNTAPLQQKLKSLRGVPNNFVRNVIARAASAAKPLAPVATGQLASSGRSRMVGDGDGEIIFDTNYAGFGHEGTDPITSGSGGDFLLAIQDWVKVKGLPTEAAFPIARSIARDGVKPNPWLKDYLESSEFERMAEQLADRELNNAVA